jgi:alpha-tubulin suppressor-like RCC1 family protein
MRGRASVAMAQTGGVTAWGNNAAGQCTIPTAANSGVAASAAGAYHTIALKDGAVLAWGYNDYGQCTIPTAAQSGVSAIAGGDIHTIALNRDIPSYQAEIAALSSQNTALTAQLNCGDLNGDGEVNGADLGRMLISWGQCQ